ncbi:hypothetical protein BDW42DRAFT_43818 [Aspergillus taichungensis]|uniref:Uncharacterized protein n=1 Tax=Aspergillus taichungensis TaxID=482145 RepID=A0A2J5HE55_9EURO|nr:hypothetical protein BDW42DRAFT_43818 [Aspergillus taichungensis]
MGGLADILVRCRPHTLSPDELYKARLAPYLLEAQEALDVKIETTHAQNEELSQKVQSQRMEIDNLLKNLEAVVGDLEGAAAAASQFTSENDLRKEAIQMEEELGTRSEK